jgi:hypothetical protein
VTHGGLVDRQEAQRLGVVHPHRQRVRLEQEPVALLGALERADQPAGLDRPRRAARQLGGEIDVRVVERPIGRDQRDRTPRLVARHQRHAHVRGRRHLAQHAQAHEVVAGRPGDELLGDLAHQLGLARAHHDGGAVRAVVPERRTVVRCGRHARHRAVLAQDVDRAPLGEAGHEHARQPLQRVLARARARQQLARAREECEPIPASLIRGHRHN